MESRSGASPGRPSARTRHGAGVDPELELVPVRLAGRHAGVVAQAEGESLSSLRIPEACQVAEIPHIGRIRLKRQPELEVDLPSGRSRRTPATGAAPGRIGLLAPPISRTAAVEGGRRASSGAAAATATVEASSNPWQTRTADDASCRNETRSTGIASRSPYRASVPVCSPLRSRP